MGFDLLTAVRVYRTALDREDRALAVGGPFLLLEGRRQPAVSALASSVAIAMALRELNPGVKSAMRFPPREEHEAAAALAPTP